MCVCSVGVHVCACVCSVCACIMCAHMCVFVWKVDMETLHARLSEGQLLGVLLLFLYIVIIRLH